MPISWSPQRSSRILQSLWAFASRIDGTWPPLRNEGVPNRSGHGARRRYRDRAPFALRHPATRTTKSYAFTHRALGPRLGIEPAQLHNAIANGTRSVELQRGKLIVAKHPSPQVLFRFKITKSRSRPTRGYFLSVPLASQRLRTAKGLRLNRRAEPSLGCGITIGDAGREVYRQSSGWLGGGSSHEADSRGDAGRRPPRECRAQPRHQTDACFEAGPDRVHEIKHDVYRLQVRRDGDAVRRAERSRPLIRQRAHPQAASRAQLPTVIWPNCQRSPAVLVVASRAASGTGRRYPGANWQRMCRRPAISS
jgi:hypothetical protein